MPKLIEPRRQPLPLLPTILVAVAVLAGGFFLYRHRAAIFPPRPPLVLESRVKAIPASPPVLVAKPEAGGETVAPAAPDPAQLARQLREFFARLDSQEYIRAHALKGGSQVYFGQLLAKVLAQPPVVAGEAESSYAILKNSAHIYRVLGGNNIALIKEILAAEKEGLEPFLAACHAWSRLPPASREQGLNLAFPEEKVYEYAAYFLNTLGGQSYLLRRAPNLRMLIQYYSLLVIDQANQEGRNRHGIAIKRAVERCRREIATMDSLANKEQYLTTLDELARRAQ